MPTTETSSSFTVTWSGQDDPGGSGIAFYDIYVSDSGGPFTPFLLDTTDTSATSTGQPRHPYGFFSVATDNVGNVEATPAAVQATTRVLYPVNPGLIPSIASRDYGQSLTFMATVSPESLGLPMPTGTVQFLVDGSDLGNPVTLVDGVAT